MRPPAREIQHASKMPSPSTRWAGQRTAVKTFQRSQQKPEHAFLIAVIAAQQPVTAEMDEARGEVVDVAVQLAVCDRVRHGRRNLGEPFPASCQRILYPAVCMNEVRSPLDKPMPQLPLAGAVFCAGCLAVANPQPKPVHPAMRIHPQRVEKIVDGLYGYCSRIQLSS